MRDRQHAVMVHLVESPQTTGASDQQRLVRDAKSAHRRKSGDTFMIGLSLSEVEQSGREVLSAALSGTSRRLSQCVREALARQQRIELAQQKETLEFALLGGELGYWEWDLVTGEVRDVLCTVQPD